MTRFKLITVAISLFVITLSLQTNVFSIKQPTIEPILINVHQHEYSEEIILPTCETEGYTIHKCICGDEYIDTYVSAEGHVYNEWLLTTNPTHNMHGTETRICEKCNNEETREYICPHESITETITNATCTKEGLIQHHCEFCNKLIDSNKIEIKEHSFSNWKTIKSAKPNEPGEQYKECECGKKEYRTIEFSPAGKNSIYIESAGINAKYAITDFTQAAVDANDIIYTTSRLNKDNPIVLGHNTRTLKHLPKTKIGSLIYIYKDGVPTIYKVIVSEKAYDLGSDIQGADTGEELLTTYDTPHLHMYTCYVEPTGKYTRWLVLAKKIS